MYVAPSRPQAANWVWGVWRFLSTIVFTSDCLEANSKILFRRHRNVCPKNHFCFPRAVRNFINKQGIRPLAVTVDWSRAWPSRSADQKPRPPKLRAGNCWRSLTNVWTLKIVTALTDAIKNLLQFNSLSNSHLNMRRPLTRGGSGGEDHPKNVSPPW